MSRTGSGSAAPVYGARRASAGGRGTGDRPATDGGRVAAGGRAAGDRPAANVRRLPGAGPSPDRRRSPRRALRSARDAGLERLLPTDEAAREARNARLRRTGTRVGCVAVAGVLVYAVFPVRTYLDQRAASDRAEEQMEVLSEENEELAEHVDSLRTDEEIERIAREQYGFVRPGEEAYGLLPPPEPPTSTTTTSTERSPD